MKYRVVIQRLAFEELRTAHRWAARHAPFTADRWLSKFHEAIRSLGDHPDRCPLAPENKKTAKELRQFLFGRKPNLFRVIYVIDADTVRVLRVRRAQRRFLTAKEIQDSIDASE